MQLLSMHVDTVRALQRLHIPFDDLTPDGLWGTPYHLIGVTGDQRDVLNAWGVVYDEVTPAVFQRAGVAVALGSGGPGGGNGNRSTASLTGGRMDARPEPRLEYRPEPRPEPRSETAAPPQSLATGAALSPQPPVVVAAPASPQQSQQSQQSQQTAAPTPPSSEAAAPSQQQQQQQSQSPAAQAPAAPASSKAPKPAASAATTAATADDQLRDGTRLRTSFRGRYREATVRGGKILLDGRPFESLTQASGSISADKNEWEFWEYFDDGAGKWRMLDREWQA